MLSNYLMSIKVSGLSKWNVTNQSSLCWSSSRSMCFSCIQDRNQLLLNHVSLRLQRSAVGMLHGPRRVGLGLVADLALCVNHRTKRASDQHHFDPATNHVSHKALFLPRRSRTIRSAGLSGRSFIIAVPQHTSAFDKGVDFAALWDICQSVTC